MAGLLYCFSVMPGITVPASTVSRADSIGIIEVIITVDIGLADIRPNIFDQGFVETGSMPPPVACFNKDR